MTNVRDRGRITLKPAGWKFPDAEHGLYEAAERLPTLKLANLSRRCLADACHQLSGGYTTGTSVPFDGMTAQFARQTVCLQLGVIVVRASGAAITLISCGYEPEALAPSRTLLEAIYRTRHAIADSSGEVARNTLRGQSSRSLKWLAGKYGDPNEIAFLDRFSHADVLSIAALHSISADDGMTEIDMGPTRDYRRASAQLHTLAHTVTTMTGLVCQEFGVDCAMPPYLSERFAHYRAHPIYPVDDEPPVLGAT